MDAERASNSPPLPGTAQSGVSRQEMLNCVWGEGYALEEHALDVHVHSLRQRIEGNSAEPKLIVTVRGVGYKLRTDT
ncbi:MAG TPA: helix-turn-helix domain-containing protein [Nitrospira sp.]|nr:helix-turn-helix domain-containing protein [Nitrospira sp.]